VTDDAEAFDSKRVGDPDHIADQ